MKSNQNVELKRGDSLDIEIPVLDHNTGAPIDLTGATLKWWAGKPAVYNYNRLIREKEHLVTKTPTFFTETVGNKTIHVLRISLVPADTADKIPGDYIHEAEVTLPNGKVHTTTEGLFILLNDLG